MIKSKLIPLTSVLKDIYFLINEEYVTEDLVMEFAIRGMEHLAVNNTYERAICILPIVNNQASYPNGMYGIHSVMGNCTHKSNEIKYVVTADSVLSNDIARDNVITLSTEKSRQIINKIINFNSIQFLNNGWEYLSLSDSPFDKSIICNSSFNLSSCCSEWFIPDNANNRFVVSFDYGHIAVSYYRFPQNEAGEFLITDHPLVAEALESYVFSKIYQKLWHSSKQGAQQKYYHYLEKWQQLSAAATGELALLSLPQYVNLSKDNTFFKDYNSNKIYGGWGREHTNFK